MVSARVEGVGFSFYTKEQVLGLSVKRVAVQPGFDQQGVPVLGGLYDPAFGPLGMHGACVTCGMSSKFCPGHCGHIELPVPIINPLLFGPCYKILQKTCHWCFNFRIRGGQAELDHVVKQLLLLEEGRVIEACNLTRKDAAETLDSGGKKTEKSATVQDESPSLLAATKRAEIVGQLMAGLKDGKCSFCGAFSPKLRSYQKSKVLVEPLPAKWISKNHDLGIELASSIFKQAELQDEKEQLSEDDGKAFVLSAADEEDDDDDGAAAAGAESEDMDERVVPAIDEVDEDADEAADCKRVPGRRWMTPLEVEEHLRRVWNRSPRLCGLLWNHLIAAEDGRFQRAATSYQIFMMNVLLVPPSRFRPPQISASSGKLTEHGHNLHLTKVLSTISAFVSDSKIKDKKEAAASRGRLWHTLQVNVAEFFDASGDSKQRDYHGGIKQILDKKEGLFRRNMMGKRVNYAARTVISPDPYIETDEIGIPMVFAKKLTFPTPVTWHNYEQLAKAVINGPDEHPGATQVEKDGIVKSLKGVSREGRVALSKTLLEHAPLQPGSTAVVHAHVQSGDFVLLNRQPSLHKPSMMGMKVRVLGQERTMRMHYANCSSFNADFDGDEMNIHLPQSLNAKTDIRFAAMSRDQYLSPKDGGPLRGLIQDHVLSGVLLTMKDTFFSRSDYQLLVYSSVYAVRPLMDIETEPPAIWKPVVMWTGKQVISTIVKHILSGRPLFNFAGQTRIKGSMWGPEGEEEGTVQFAGGDLVTGVIDKSQSGASANGFVHACYTLYGGDVAERLLTSLGRVFTKFLQMYGFTCGIEDFLLSAQVEDERRRVLALAQERSIAAVKEFVDGKVDDVAVLEKALKERLVKIPTEETRLDGTMKKVSHNLTSTVVDLAIPTGMRKPFPHNNFFLMVTTGAKGSTVNFSMIACCLGQMELEGRRVARMASGRTLPAFRPYQTDLVAGGFISQRFLTGIRPCEFYHHCMAGREGLIDTAVKTSRSGYLQRCIIKHLESLVVNYDGTVRDSDGSVVQFAYGEDGLDPVHHASVHNLKLWNENKRVAAMRLPALTKQVSDAVGLYHSRFLSKTLKMPDFGGHRMMPLSDEIRAGSLLETRSPFEFGVVSDKFLDKLREAKVEDPELFKLMMFNYLRLLVPPGESVGVLAGQSIGEPSTQMTLNSVAWDTEIIVNDRVVRIGEWIDALMESGQAEMREKGVDYFALASEARMFVPTVDACGKTSWGRITAVTRHPPHGDLVRIKTRAGREVVATRSKSLLVWNGEAFVHKNGCDAVVGDCVPTVVRLGEPEAPVARLDVAKYGCAVDLDNETGLAVGMYLAHGSCSGATVAITSRDKAMIARLIQWLDRRKMAHETVAETDENVRVASTVTVTIRSDTLARLFQLWLGAGASKRAPSEAFAASREFVAGLLDGFLAGDATECDAGLLRDVSLLCARVGLFGRVSGSGKSFTLVHCGGDMQNDVALDPIVHIEAVSESLHPKVYDLTVPSTTNFVLANGLGVADTFHLAGHGDVNVTLGIPRLRELLMGATTPKIPSMTIPVLASADLVVLANFKRNWKNGVVSALVTDVVCSRVLPEDQNDVALHALYFRVDKAACLEYGLAWNDVLEMMMRVFERLKGEIIRDVRQKTRRTLISKSVGTGANATDEVDEEKTPKKRRGGRKKDVEGDDEEDGADAEIDDEEVDQNEDEEEGDDEEKEDEEELLDEVDSEEGVGAPDAVAAGQQGRFDDSAEEEDHVAVANKKQVRSTPEFDGEVDEDGFLSEMLSKKLGVNDRAGIMRVLGVASHEKEGVIRLRIVTRLSGPQVLVSSLAEWAVQSTPIRIMPLVKRTVFVEAQGDKPAHVITEGSNIPWMCSSFAHVLAVNELKCNDIGHILRTYGVEAARTALAEEIGAVFKAYGINVGYRHLSLIADYQTFHGGYRGFNRHGMSEHKNSPLLNMSFETTLQFATSAALHGKYDDCATASARLVLGIVPNVGTGCMDLLQCLETREDP